MRWAKTNWCGVKVYVVRMNPLERFRYWVDFQKTENIIRKRSS